MPVAISFGRQVVFWIAAVFAFALFLWLLHGILLPFVAGMALAYLLDPVADRLERLGMSRLFAALAIIFVFVLVFVLLILIIAPLIGSQLSAFAQNVPGYIRRAQVVMTERNLPWLRRFFGEGFSPADAAMGDVVSQGIGWLTTFLRSLWSGGQALVSVFSLLVVTPVVAFYLLVDWDRMVSSVDRWVPVRQRETVRALAREIDRAVAGFVRGQSAVCLFLGTYYAVGLSLVGLNFAILIGLFAGLITFIPYLGSISGLVLATGVAFAQFWPDWTWILVVVAVFLFGQFLEGNIVTPKLVGESVGLHPVWLMFALFAFGYLFGFVGFLIAVPLAAAVGVIVRFALRRYLASPFYSGVEPAPGEQPLRPPNRTLG